MKDQKHIAWLYEQLPGLVSEGTLTAEAAERMRRRYGELEAGSGKRWAVVLFSIIGAVLIGGGIILLLAHNWDQLGRPIRTVLSFAPLVVGQVLAGWALWRNSESMAWREGAGTFLTVAIGSSISLIAQTYNISGDFGDFMLTWVLLGLPVAYLLRATLPAILYLVGITVWTGAMWESGWKGLGYWALMALALPWWWREARANRYQARPVLFGWMLALTLPIGLGISLHRIIDVSGAWLLMYGALAGVLFLAGCRWWGDATAAGQRPLQTIGALGAVGLALALSFEDVWREAMWHNAYWQDFGRQPWPVALAWVIIAGWLVAAVALWVESFRSRNPARTFLGAMPVVTVIGYVLANGAGSRGGAMLLFNLYLLALGVGVLVAGVRQQRLGVINGGMLILSALILCRFFDADLGFVVRGVVFIALGVGFLATNLVLLRKKGAVAQ